MTVQPHPHIPLPLGADPDDPNNFDWEPVDGADGEDWPAYRIVGRTFGTFKGENIRTLVVQFSNGEVATGGGDGPRVYFGHTDYLPDEARTLANDLLAAADLADEWAGKSDDHHAEAARLLATVEHIKRALVRAASVGDEPTYRRCAESASYLSTAQYAIADAVEAIR